MSMRIRGRDPAKYPTIVSCPKYPAARIVFGDRARLAFSGNAGSSRTRPAIMIDGISIDFHQIGRGAIPFSRPQSFSRGTHRRQDYSLLSERCILRHHKIEAIARG